MTFIFHFDDVIIVKFLINPIETIVAFMRRAIAFLSGPWAHICDENKGFTQTPELFCPKPSRVESGIIRKRIQCPFR